MAKIITEIKCNNLAPISKLDKTIESDNLRLAVFADNGSGKTFLSKTFRLLERGVEPLSSKSRKIPTDKFISFDKDKCSVSVKITGKDGNIAEEFKIDIKRGSLPTIPKTNYIFHCFNEDYVEENIYNLSCDKDEKIEGFILGNINIALDKEKKELAQRKQNREELEKQVKQEISAYTNDKLGHIPHISRLSDYKCITFEDISENINTPFAGVIRSYEELIGDYDKIKSVPEDLTEISLISEISIKPEFIDDIQESLFKQYTLSSFAEDFKQKIKPKQQWIETGLKLLKKTNSCPFCEQTLDNEAQNLIDQYTEFIRDEESKTIKSFNEHKDKIAGFIRILNNTVQNNNKKIIEYTNYKNDYFPSLMEKNLSELDIEDFTKSFESLTQHIEKKIENISSSIKIGEDLKKQIRKNFTSASAIVGENNDKIKEINKRKSNTTEESKNIRKDLCKVIFNNLLEIHKSSIQKLREFNSEISLLQADIKTKGQQLKVSKKEKVADTIENVLRRFFGDKYTINKNTFRLSLKKNVLDRGQAKDVLSQGEKNIIAFAYFLGDVHLKVETEDDYKKLFFIIDDPISSMDYNHVYTVNQVIKDLEEITKINGGKRFVIFTHHLDFMRVLVGNNTVSKSLVLKNSEIKDFNNNLTIPYILHLHDIYRISEGLEEPNHTTPNSIRHIIETLTKFENILADEGAVGKYIKDNFPHDSKTYTLVQDLSHGGWRSEQAPIYSGSITEVCTAIINLIDNKYKGQVEYCRSLTLQN